MKAKVLPDSLPLTLSCMKQLIIRGSRDPLVIQLANRIVENVPDRATVTPEQQDRLEIAAVWRWVKTNIRYTRDGWDLVHNVPGEKLADCEATLRLRGGDCDDHVILAGAILTAIGQRVEIWTGGRRRPVHVFLVAYTTAGTAQIIDTTAKHIPFGQQPGGPGWSFWRYE